MEFLRYVTLNATGEPQVLLDMNDMVAFAIVRESFQVNPASKQSIMSTADRRYSGSRQVGETTDNGTVSWSCLVTGDTAEECVERVEELLAQAEANPNGLLLEWRPEGAPESAYYEVRGTANWTPKYVWAQFAGAQSMVVEFSVPVAPLARQLPVTVFEQTGITLPAVVAIPDVPGDAPALAEVSITTGLAPNLAFIAAQFPECIAVDAGHIYWARPGGWIGRATLAGGSVEKEWVHAEGKPRGIAVDASHIYWTDAANGFIGRATLAGGTVEKSFIEGAISPWGLAVTASHIYWTNSSTGAGGNSIGRSSITGTEVTQTLITGLNTPLGLAVFSEKLFWCNSATNSIGRAQISGTSVEPKWIEVAGQPRGIVVTGEFIHWTNRTTGAIGRSAHSGLEVNQAYVLVGSEPSGVAVDSEHLYWGYNEGTGLIGRAFLLGSEPPVWALIGWAAKPTTGLATAPFGVLDSSEAVGAEGWAYGTLAGAKGGKALTGSAEINGASWPVDPATLVPDSFQGEISFEVYARLLVPSGASEFQVSLEAQPQDGLGYGAARTTDEWGPVGRPITPATGAAWRTTRVGTLHLLVNPLQPRIWMLRVNALVITGTSALDHLVLVPSTQRCCSPTGKPNDEAFPRFITNIAPTVKTIRSDLSAVISKPGSNGHPDHGLGGQLLEIPPGETDMLIKLSSLVPDDPTVSASSEQLAHEATLKVTVTPRWYLTRSS